jgi:hypothetical protein
LADFLKIKANSNGLPFCKRGADSVSLNLGYREMPGGEETVMGSSKNNDLS